MSHANSLPAFLIILGLYAVIGVSAVIGTAVVTRKLLAPKWEQAFYAGLLVAIAAFYLAFAAYFDAGQAAWRVEFAAVLVFSGLALIGVRVPVALMLGYVLHGGWDFLHELQAHGTAIALAPGQATEIPLAYGALCAAFDLGLAAYVYLRRAEWAAAWTRT